MEHDRLGGPKGLVELREYGSYPGFLMFSGGTSHPFFTWLSQGQRLTDKLEVSPLCEGVYTLASPPPHPPVLVTVSPHCGLTDEAGDCLLPIGASQMKQKHSPFAARFRTPRALQYLGRLCPRGPTRSGSPGPP